MKNEIETKIKINKIYCMDCFKGMEQLKPKSVNMILCDLPYGVTQNPQDKPLNLNKVWKEYKRIIKDNGIIILTSQFPFTYNLINSNKKWFKYDLIWNKTLSSGFLNANRMPLRTHEHILIFYKKLPTYNPIFTIGKPLHSKGYSYKNKKPKNQNYGEFTIKDDKRKGSIEKYPISIIKISKKHPSIQKHPTEKPIELAEYLIRMYSNKKDLILDNCIGTGWTAIACKRLNRNFIGFEINPKYVKIANKRLLQEVL